MTENTNQPMSQSVAEIDQRLASEYATGKSLKTVADTHGLSALRVRDALLRAGAQVRGRGRTSASKLTAEEDKKILALHDEGYRAEVITTKTGIMIELVKRIVRRSGRVKSRMKAEATNHTAVPT